MPPQKPPSFFPELREEEQRQADAWLFDYIRLVLRIWRERVQVQRHKTDAKSS